MQRKQTQLKNHPDFKIDGKWVQKFSPEPYVVYTTRAGVLWTNMTQRCKTGGSLQEAIPAYVGCINGFESFQNFADWCQYQIGYTFKDENGRFWQLDKDILLKNNKVYSPETCIFVPKSLNCLLERRANYRGDYPIGVSKTKKGFDVKITRDTLKLPPAREYHKTVESAFLWYKEQKEMYIKQVADYYKDQIDHRAYEALYKYEVEIHD